MREALTDFNQTLPQNDKVSLREKGKKRIRLSPLILNRSRCNCVP